MSNLPVFSVSECIASLNQTLEYSYGGIQVEGEVASFKVNQSKYVFFDLKDSEGTLGCFMMAWQLRVPLEDGMKVVISGQPKLTPWGKFSLTVRSIKPSGEGSLKRSFELLKQKLEKEGLFAEERKRPLPTIPSSVGVISSTTAAGYADFVTLLDARWGGLSVNVAHTQVQGEVASDQIIRAIRYFNETAELVDVLVIVRGGGSADDLAVFNDEALVREIAASRIPTLVGIGHETDTTLSDLVADVRAVTPSNAAQLLVPDRMEVVQAQRARVRAAGRTTERAISTQIEQIQERLFGALSRWEKAIEHQLTLNQSSRRTLAAYDPRAVLERGYAIVRGAAVVGGTIEVETKRAIMKAEVHNVDKK